MGDETGSSSCGGCTLFATQSHNLILINVGIESNHLGESCAERGPFHPGEIDPQSIHLLFQLAPDQIRTDQVLTIRKLMAKRKEPASDTDDGT